MKIPSLITVILTLLFLTTQSQNPQVVWPVKGKVAGEDILYRPNDYILSEHNLNGLYIKTLEGTPILAPCNGTITSFVYSYKSMIHESMSFPFIDGSDIEIRENIVKKMLHDYNMEVDPKYISISIGILTNKNEQYYIDGIRPYREFKTGYAIKKGDIIGTAGYTYKEIEQSCISLSRSINGKSADPMSPFGLKSSFVNPTKFDFKKVLPVEKLKEDFIIFREALEEGHTGLYDYISKPELDHLFDQTLNSINRPMNSEDFKKIFIPIIHSIRDSHTSLLSIFSDNPNVYYPQVFFGWLNDSLIVTRSLPNHEEFIGKRIIEINGIKSDSLLQSVKQLMIGSDGFIESMNEFNLLCMGWASYFLAYPSQDGSFNVTFSDGSSSNFKLEKKIKNKPLKINPKWRYVSFQKQNFNCRKINDTVAYLDINTFQLNQKDLEEIFEYVKTIQDSSYSNLIIDLRNNTGGSADAVAQIFALIANNPFKGRVFSMVNNNDTYRFFKYTENYTPNFRHIFNEYKPNEGKTGFFIPFDSIPWNYPNDSIHFVGKIYVLTNEHSLSASTVFAALVHKYGRGVIVGRETGSTYYQLNAEKFATIILKNTAIRFRFPLVKVVFDSLGNSDIPWGRGVLPNYPIKLTLDELEGINDVFLDSTLSLIKHAKYIQNPIQETEKADKLNLILIIATIFIIILSLVIIINKHRMK